MAMRQWDRLGRMGAAGHESGRRGLGWHMRCVMIWGTAVLSGCRYLVSILDAPYVGGSWRCSLFFRFAGPVVSAIFSSVAAGVCWP